MLVKTVVVTGCANGIGKHLFRSFGRNGYKAVGLDREVCPGDTYRVDLSCYDNLVDVLGELREKRVDVVLNVAGICPRYSFEGFTDSGVDDVFNSNVRSIINTSRFFYRNLLDSRGVIVNVSSVHALSSLDYYSVYAMSKGAVESFSRSLAVELSRFGVRVNCIRLGAVDTGMLDYDEDEVACIPLGRTVGLDDVFSLARELVENGSLTGSVVTLDCGMLSKLCVEM